MNRKTQRDAILGLLLSARGGWVELPEIMRLAAQYGARIFELRRLGFHIENRIRDVDGTRHSWFRLVPSEQAKAVRPEVRNSPHCRIGRAGGAATIVCGSAPR
jgi:hypothetical protein